MALPFRDRADAGRQLAAALNRYAHEPDLLVLALPRGGVPVGYEVASELGAPLDVLVVRKLGTPGQPELAMGAVASGGVRVLNPSIVDVLGIPSSVIDRVAEEELKEVERRERAYRGGRPPAPVENRTVIVVDDGVATGSTFRAALQCVRKGQPRRLIAAFPVGAAETVPQLRALADEVVCLESPEPFLAISLWYSEFPQTSDEEVRALLERAHSGTAGVRG
jgi:putative phosphoribosyl transferase